MEDQGNYPEELHKVGEVTLKQYPYEDGDVKVLGPQTFIDPTEEVISYKGENYVRAKTRVGEVEYSGTEEDQEKASVQQRRFQVEVRVMKHPDNEVPGLDWFDPQAITAGIAEAAEIHLAGEGYIVMAVRYPPT